MGANRSKERDPRNPRARQKDQREERTLQEEGGGMISTCQIRKSHASAVSPQGHFWTAEQ